MASSFEMLKIVEDEGSGDAVSRKSSGCGEPVTEREGLYFPPKDELLIAMSSQSVTHFLGTLS
jgi:hypothetical protein